MDLWRQIRGFPNYSVCYDGRIRNDKTERILTPTINPQGLLYVGLLKDRVQHKRSVTLIVASAFVLRPARQSEVFDTPINLDGDRLNNHASNLMWRPRWFAIKYNHQFDWPEASIPTPIEEITKEEKFTNSWEAALKYGLIDTEIRMSIERETYVWPTYQRFRVI